MNDLVYWILVGDVLMVTGAYLLGRRHGWEAAEEYGRALLNLGVTDVSDEPSFLREQSYQRGAGGQSGETAGSGIVPSPPPTLPVLGIPYRSALRDVK